MTRTGHLKIICIAAVLYFTGVALYAQTFNTIFTFNGKNGTYVNDSLIQGLDGSMYGVTTTTVFRIAPGGKLTTIYNFCSLPNCADGSNAQGTLVQTPDGSLYGTTSEGGPLNNGEIFKITPAGKLEIVYGFGRSINDARYPISGLTLGPNGNFYGTTVEGGFGPQDGTIFEVAPPDIVVLHSFGYGFAEDGWNPTSSLVLASNGNFYGTTPYGGDVGDNQGAGTAFEITPSGKYQQIRNFCRPWACDLWPTGPLIQGSNGRLIGTTLAGGIQNCVLGCGTIYELTLSGKFTKLYNFCPQTNCTDGIGPQSGVIQASDGSLYGTTSSGGSGSLDCYDGLGRKITCGTVFQATTERTVTALYSFCTETNCSDGANPVGGLVQATDGTIYGSTTLYGDKNCVGSNGQGCGTLFRLSLGLPPFVQAQINFGKIGQMVNILGNKMIGTTSVKFNGVPAEFKVMSDTYLKAQLPNGATTGMIEVTAPGGTLNSTVPFYVLP
jgi:uncharacterized repeat protein (TIGR03803 family)